MTEIYQNLRSQLREHFIDYLKAGTEASKAA